MIDVDAVADEEGIDLAEVDAMIAAVGADRSVAIPLLQAVQERYNYLPQECLRHICGRTEITPADIAGVSSFYPRFRNRPAGRHNIKVCVGTACHVKGAPRVLDAVRRELGIAADDDTDAERRFTVSEVPCLGCCTLAPAVQIDDVTYGHLTPATIKPMIDDFLELQKKRSKSADAGSRRSIDRPLAEIRIGLGSCCIAGGSEKIFREIEETVVSEDLPGIVKMVGCVGMCHQTPLVEVVDEDGESTTYAKVSPGQGRRIVHRHLKPRGIGRKISRGMNTALDKILADQEWEPIMRHALDVRDSQVCAFQGRQVNIAAEYCGSISPLDMDEYRRHGGFEALAKVLEEGKRSEIIDTVVNSGLRGRGGAGFSAGEKWSIVAEQNSAKKYLVMNGDEGDPGAFMDRMLLESYPYRIIEGTAIAAFAVGADEGILYIRSEYPLALSRMRTAIENCREAGLLGGDILASGFGFDLRIMEGAGAFVCGEETALLASLEGGRGMPVLRPPYPAVKGYRGCPTLINNVETYACIPWIIRNGAESFAALGTEHSKGSKVFSLTGKVVRGGLIEVPMGITIREIVEEIGGGVADGRRFKAVQIGGPSGGCIPAELADTPVDYEALSEAGAIMGSGGLVVLDDADCMVDIARYFLRFTQEQSCGKCTFCRVGTKQMLELLDKICEGKGSEQDIDTLEELAHAVKEGSLCGLGRTAPNPVLSTIRYFRGEYEAHIDGRCPAGKCRNLISYYINEDCIGCTKCIQRCPVDAIAGLPYERHVIDDEKCTRCDGCRQVCPVDAVEIGKREDG